jgi:hypothetical protein
MYLPPNLPHIVELHFQNLVFFLQIDVGGEL